MSNDDIRLLATGWQQCIQGLLWSIREYLRYNEWEQCDRYEKDKFRIYLEAHKDLQLLERMLPAVMAWLDGNSRLSAEVFANAAADMAEGLRQLRTVAGPDLARLDRAYTTTVAACRMILEIVPVDMKVVVVSANDERDRHMFKRRKAGAKLGEIAAETVAHKTWESLETPEGVVAAIKRYCKRTEEPFPGRQNRKSHKRT
jgi:hypothetical protein